MRLQTVRIFQKIRDIQREMYKCESVNQINKNDANIFSRCFM